MKNLDNTIATVNKFNPGIFTDLRGEFNTEIVLNITPVEEDQKWAEVTCDIESFGINDSQNLTDDEENGIMDLLEYLQDQFRREAGFSKMVRQTEYSLSKY